MWRKVQVNVNPGGTGRHIKTVRDMALAVARAQPSLKIVAHRFSLLLDGRFAQSRVCGDLPKLEYIVQQWPLGVKSEAFAILTGWRR
jgi:hypothetical protein